MIFITYYKRDGEITSPCIVDENEQTLESLFGDRAGDIKQICDSISFSLEDGSKESGFLNEIIRGNYKVNLETKQLEKKSSEEFNIKYM
ncbi:hypothetical protein CSC2_12440 [Clostridium zeae]|uniref:Uncharacterized protein n=1 Tax=Clostridium zeae TaxID=2759022 RepID=A0ABQ1E7J7_9CLOT|nr:hypothetical protein [Clostridium zeae]GFZ30718.1 hypothetical protein CSC2_12440 [Clostridium zeae]